MPHDLSEIHFAGDLDRMNREAAAYVSGVGLTVMHLKDGIIDGLPLTQSGIDVPLWLLRDALDAAESKVESDCDMFIWERDVYCVSNLDDSGLDAEDDRAIYPALDKPKNWFAGQRYGMIKLPRGPAKKLIRVTVLPYGFMSAPIDIPVDDEAERQGKSRARLDRNKLRFVPGRNGMLFGSAVTQMRYTMYDGETIPNGLEVVYRAGLSERQLRLEGAKFRTLVLLQAAIQAITMLQARMAGGMQKEALQTDGLANTVEVAKRDSGGPLGGELRSLRKNYDDLLRSVMADDAIRALFLG